MAEINRESYEFGRENTQQQFRGGTADKAMNETSRKQKFQRTDASYNEQRNTYDYENAAAYDLPPPEQSQWQRYTNSTVEVIPPKSDVQPQPIGQAEAASPFFKSTDEKIRNLDAQSERVKGKIDQYDAARENVTARQRRKEYGGKGEDSEGGVRVRVRRGEYFHGRRITGSRRLIDRSDGWYDGKRASRAYRQATKQDYDEYLRKQSGRRIRREAAGRLLFRKTKDLLNDESMSEDELAGDLKRRTGRLVRGQIYMTRHNRRTLKKYRSPYYRLEFYESRQQLLDMKRKRLQDRKRKEDAKKKIREAASREQKRKLKKAMVQYQKAENGSFLRRTRQNILTGRKKRQYQKQVRKHVSKIVFAASGIFVSFMAFLVVFFLIIIAVTYGGSETAANTISMNDYGTLTEVMAYFNDLETDLNVYLNGDRDALEEELDEEYGPDIYEYVYDLADFGFSANYLMAYLSAKFGTFTSEDEGVRAEMDSLFAEMYQLSIRTGFAERDGERVKICYVTLTKKELIDVIKERIENSDRDALFAFVGISLSGGGKQIFNPVMREDWTERISSNFGSRLHPIDGVVKQHNGVDIAVPEGTKLYSAASGTVTTAQYTDSTGYMVTVQAENGYKITYMHMKSYVVARNQTIKAGEFIGLSGNTGNSTGPHLHLGIQKPDGTYANPILYIPTTMASGEEEN
ncbi:MAG: M23 family metallopeptidase [Clostridium sp.]|nr:M23 family metallopeptidase [Clostridium sp.]